MLRIQLGVIVTLSVVGALHAKRSGAVPFNGDLHGTWSNGTLTPLERPAQAEDLDEFDP